MATEMTELLSKLPETTMRQILLTRNNRGQTLLYIHTAAENRRDEDVVLMIIKFMKKACSTSGIKSAHLKLSSFHCTLQKFLVITYSAFKNLAKKRDRGIKNLQLA